jgi:hypothetical protein
LSRPLPITGNKQILFITNIHYMKGLGMSTFVKESIIEEKPLVAREYDIKGTRYYAGMEIYQKCVSIFMLTTKFIRKLFDVNPCRSNTSSRQQ